MALNPYAPPVADAGPADAAVVTVGLPRDTVRLARLWLVSSAVAFALGGAAALFMRAELWDPGPTFTPETYTSAFSLHGLMMIVGLMMPALFGGVGHVFVADAMPARSGPSFGVGVVAWLAWAAGLAGLAKLVLASDWFAVDPTARPGLFIMSMFALAGAMAILAAQLFAAARAGWATTAARTRVAVGGFVASIVALAVLMPAMLMPAMRVYPMPFLVSVIFASSGVAAIAVVVHVVARLGGWAPWATLVVITVVSTFLADMLGHESPIPATSGGVLASVIAVLAQLVLAIVLVIAVLRSRARWHPAFVYVVLGVVPALVVGGPVQAFLGALSVDVHLHDTYFVLGEMHVSAYLAVFAILIAMHAWGGELLGRDAHPMLARAGALLVCGGTLRMAYEMLALGQAGMPRRYFTYIDTFEPQHRTATLAAAATALGFVFVLVAWLVGRKRTPA